MCIDPEGRQIVSEVRFVTNAVNKPAFTAVSIADKVVSFELDTGSGVPVMTESRFSSLFPDSSVKESNVVLHSVSGPVPVMGQCEVNISFCGQSFDLRVILVSH